MLRITVRKAALLSGSQDRAYCATISQDNNVGILHFVKKDIRGNTLLSLARRIVSETNPLRLLRINYGRYPCRFVIKTGTAGNRS